MTLNIVEIVGWLAAGFTLCSFLFSNQRLLRFINLIGCFCWIVFGLLLQEINYQVVFVNATIAIIHLIWFVRNRQAKIV
jgi:hypothetical protein